MSRVRSRRCATALTPSSPEQARHRHRSRTRLGASHRIPCRIAVGHAVGCGCVADGQRTRKTIGGQPLPVTAYGVIGRRYPPPSGPISQCVSAPCGSVLCGGRPRGDLGGGKWMLRGTPHPRPARRGGPDPRSPQGAAPVSKLAGAPREAPRNYPPFGAWCRGGSPPPRPAR